MPPLPQHHQIGQWELDAELIRRVVRSLWNLFCSISLVVKRDLAKVESRVRLSYIAPKDTYSNFQWIINFCFD